MNVVELPTAESRFKILSPIYPSWILNFESVIQILNSGW